MNNVISFCDFRQSGRREISPAAQGQARACEAGLGTDESREATPREYIEKTAMQLFEIATSHKMSFLAYLLIMAVEEARSEDARS